MTDLNFSNVDKGVLAIWSIATTRSRTRPGRAPRMVAIRAATMKDVL